jgi:hypothetical protein
VLKCNNTEEFIYSGCYSVCQEMRFSNGTGSDPFMIGEQPLLTTC